MNTEPEPEILYHYCSNDAFLKIVGGNSIWLSDISLSNDSMEGKWLDKVFSEYCDNRGVHSKISGEFRLRIMSLVSAVRALGFCLSKDSDVLSQWRGYADNGAGIAIGFRRDILEGLTKKICPGSWKEGFFESSDFARVIYKVEDQFKAIDSIFNDEKEVGKGIAFLRDAVLNFSVIDKLYVLKNDAFKEEGEFRVIWLFAGEKESAHWRNGYIDFRQSGGCVIPYRSQLLCEKSENKTTRPIAKVVLGPRNITPISVVEGFLAKHGHENVEVVPSAASYR